RGARQRRGAEHARQRDRGVRARRLPHGGDARGSHPHLPAAQAGRVGALLRPHHAVGVRPVLGGDPVSLDAANLDAAQVDTTVTTLRLACIDSEAPPLFSKSPDGVTRDGYEPEAAALVMQRLGARVEWVMLPWEEMIPAV